MRVFGTSFAYWHKIMTVLSGMVVAQVIALAGSLLIARLYMPEQYGAFSIWLGAAQILSIGITGRLEASLGLEADGRSRNELTSVCILVVFFVGVIFFSLLVFANAYSSEGLAELYDLPPILLWLFVPHSIGMAVLSIGQSWAANGGMFKKLSTIRIGQNFFIVSIQIAAGFIRPDVVSLALAQVGAVCIMSIFCLRMMSLRSAIPESRKAAVHMVRTYLKKYHRFPLLSLPADLINTTAAQLPIIIIGSRFGADIAGYYALAARMMGAPISLLGGAVRDVFKRAANEEFRSIGHCQSIYRRTFWVLLGLSLPMAALVMPFSETVFSIFFGEQWAQAGTIAGWLLPMYTLGFLASPLSYTFYIVQKQNIDLFWQIGLVFITLLTLLSTESYRDTLIFYGGGYALMYVVYLILSYKCCRPR